MLQYLQLQLAQVMALDEEGPRARAVIVFLGGGWEMLRRHFEHFPASNPVFWITVFWAMDWLLGSALAIRDRRWSPSRAGLSVLKWLIWMTVLAVAWGFRDAGFLGASWIAAIMEAAVIVAEGSSVLRNAAHLSGNPRAKRLISRFADAADSKLDQLEQRLGALEQTTAVPRVEVNVAVDARKEESK